VSAVRLLVWDKGIFFFGKISDFQQLAKQWSCSTASLRDFIAAFRACR